MDCLLRYGCSQEQRIGAWLMCLWLNKQAGLQTNTQINKHALQSSQLGNEGAPATKMHSRSGMWGCLWPTKCLFFTFRGKQNKTKHVSRLLAIYACHTWLFITSLVLLFSWSLHSNKHLVIFWAKCLYETLPPTSVEKSTILRNLTIERNLFPKLETMCMSAMIFFM